MSEQDPELSPEQEEHLRALLADLGSAGEGAEPLPADVAARLDDTLAGLVAGRTAARSRSRWRPRLAVAAAAVVVLGLGGVAVAQLGHSEGQASSGTAADSGAGGSTAASRPATTPSPGNLSGTASSPGTAASPDTFSSRQGYAAATPQLRSAAFAAEVKALVVSTTALRVPGAEDSAGATRKAPPAAATCTGPATTDGAGVLPVTLDSSPAALVVHPVTHGTRLVEAWSCDGTHRLASTTVAP